MRNLRAGATALLLSPLAACGYQMVGWPDADQTAPTVISTAPDDGATFVPLNAPVSATFSERMDPATITGVTFTLQDGSESVDAAVSYAGLTAFFAPDMLLHADTEYTATIGHTATDLAGNELAADYVWTFTTGHFVDLTPPEVTATNPIRGAVDVGLQANVYATFNEPMNGNTINDLTFTLADGATALAGAVNGVGAAATFNPADDLIAGRTYTATITTGASDLAGNGLVQNYQWTFTARAEVDETPPFVVLTNPDDLVVGVPITSVVLGAFSETMDLATIDDTTFLVFGPGAVPVTGSVVYNTMTPVATFTPMDDLESDTTYTARITTGVQDLAGNAMLQDYEWTFTTRTDLDLIPPRVVLTNPLDLALGVPVSTLVTAAFSEPMDPATVTDVTFELTGPGTTTVDGSVAYSLLTPIATFTPDAELDADTTYTATVHAAASDLAGNPMIQDYEWTFKTGSLLDIEPPFVVLTNPEDAEPNVALDTTVSAAFSEAMDGNSLDSSTFVVSGPGAVILDGSMSYDPLSLVVTFTPDLPLELDTTYDAIITTGAMDLTGNGMVQDYLWSFTTEAAPTGLQPIDLGSLETFVAVAGAGLTNSNSSGVTTLNGDVGLYPTGTCMGDGSPCTLTNPVINGTLYANDPGGIAMLAKTDLVAAYVDGMARPPGTIVNDISGMILPSGVYTSSSTMSVAVGGTVVLDAMGNADAVWIFQVGSSLTVNNNAQILLVNGARAKNVFWVAFASSTLGSEVNFQGSVLAGASNSVGTDSVVVGRLLCTTGQITLLSNNITLPPL